MADRNFDEVLKGSIGDITATFGDYDDDGLKALAAAEGKGAKRSGLLSAIESEQGSRALNKRALELQESAKKEGVRLHTDADVDSLAQERLQALQSEQDKARETADKERDDKITALSQQVEALTKERDKLKARAPAKAKAPAKPRRLSVDPTAAGKADRSGAFSVAFTDEHDTTLGEILPDLEFDNSAFEPFAKNNALVLKQPIDFPEGVGRVEVSKVWLLDGNDKAVAVSELVSPLPVGGGSRSRIPEGFLRFEGVGRHDGAKAKEAVE